MPDLVTFDPATEPTTNAFAAAQGGGIDPNFTLGLLNALRGDIGSLASSAWDFIRTPADIARGKYSLNQISDLAPGYALGLASASPVNALMAPETSLGIFGGRMSATAPTNRLYEAMLREKFKSSPESVYNTTGWFRGPEGGWRYTIPDEAAQLRLNLNPVVAEELRNSQTKLRLPNTLQPFPNFLIHPDLYVAYPQLKDWQVGGNPLYPGALGQAWPSEKTIRLSPQSYNNMLSTLLHETQHAVQDIEGFPSGGQPAEFLPRDFYDHVERLDASKNFFLEEINKYGNLSGEDKRNIDRYLSSHRFGTHGTEIPPQFEDSWNKLPASVRSVGDKLASNYSLVRAVQNDAFDKYRRLSGEVEARTVQEQLARRDWKTPPWTFEGYVPYEEQIIRRSEKGAPNYSLVPVDHDPFSLVPVDHDPFAEMP